MIASATFIEFVIVIALFVVFSGTVGALTGNLDLHSPLVTTILAIHDELGIIASIISMIAIAIAIYAYIHIGELLSEEEKKLGLELTWNSEREQKNTRWQKVEQYMSSLNSSDWKMGILEADAMLDQITERMGYVGTSLGERMKHIESSDFPFLDEAWTAHKMRNMIAHQGTEYNLTRSDAERTINIYYRIFKDLGYL